MPVRREAHHFPRKWCACTAGNSVERCRRKVRIVRCGISVIWSVTLATLREPTQFGVVSMIHRNKLIFSTERFGPRPEPASPWTPGQPGTDRISQGRGMPPKGCARLEKRHHKKHELCYTANDRQKYVQIALTANRTFLFKR